MPKVELTNELIKFGLAWLVSICVFIFYVCISLLLWYRLAERLMEWQFKQVFVDI